MAGLPLLNEEDSREFREILAEFLQASQASRVLIVERAGYLIAAAGETPEVDLEELSTITSNAFNVTHHLALCLGETDLGILHQRGLSFETLIFKIEENSLLVVVYASHIKTMIVENAAANAIDSIKTQLTIARSRSPGVEVDLADLDPHTADTIFLKRPKVLSEDKKKS